MGMEQGLKSKWHTWITPLPECVSEAGNMSTKKFQIVQSLLATSADNRPRLSKIKTMLAFSKVDLRATFKKLANSLFESDPDPSAVLFDIDIPAPRS